MVWQEFLSSEHLYKFLRGHPEGQALIKRIAHEKQGADVADLDSPDNKVYTGGCVPVINELHPDGYIQAYAPKSVVVHFVNRPIVSGVAAGVRVDEHIDETLPRLFRGVRSPHLLRGTGQVTQFTIADMMRWSVYRECWQAVTALHEKRKREAKRSS